MKKMIASLAAVALFAAPALAELTNTILIPKGSYTIQPAGIEEEARGVDPANDVGIYNNLQLGNAQTQYREPNNAGNFVGDDLHMITGGAAMTGFRWVYSDNGDPDGAGPLVSSHSSTLLFSHNTAADGGPVTNFALIATGTFAGSTAGFNVTGLPNATPMNPGGGWLITLGLPAIVSGPDIWVGLRSNSSTVDGVDTLGLRGTSRTPQTSPGVGSSHNLHYTSDFLGPTSFYTVPNGGSFRMAVLPEPAVAGLLALGGMVVLRRRARA